MQILIDTTCSRWSPSVSDQLTRSCGRIWSCVPPQSSRSRWGWKPEIRSIMLRDSLVSCSSDMQTSLMRKRRNLTTQSRCFCPRKSGAGQGRAAPAAETSSYPSRRTRRPAGSVKPSRPGKPAARRPGRAPTGAPRRRTGGPRRRTGAPRRLLSAPGKAPHSPPSSRWCWGSRRSWPRRPAAGPGCST